MNGHFWYPRNPVHETACLSGKRHEVVTSFDLKRLSGSAQRQVRRPQAGLFAGPKQKSSLVSSQGQEVVTVVDAKCLPQSMEDEWAVILPLE